MTLFRLDSSIRREGSVSRQVADVVEREWLQHHPDDQVVRRDLGTSPLPADAWTLAVSAGQVAEADRTPQQQAAVSLAASLADELIAADAVVLGAPLYNYGIPQHLKAWIDLVITDPRFAPGVAGLSGRPVTVVVARGGGYGPGTPREGWDHATPYLERVFTEIFGADLTVVVAELTLADVVPAMAELRGLAAASREGALQLAAETGRAHAQRVGTAS